ncbi:resolvase [Clostridia bacterium]|nr:resolvase [Clostridia bacterium]
MIADCESGLFDLIVTKSVSRFARNLVDCISLVRRLKNLNPPVGVFFETDNLYTLAENSELMLSLLASFAQEESLKKSESMNWSLAQRLKSGKLLTPSLLGYDRNHDGVLIVNKSEAATVSFIFSAFLGGFATRQIADILTDIGRPTKTGETTWNEGSVCYILKNERYCGNVLTWKTFTNDIFEHRKRRNRQDRDQYLYKNTHEAIVSEKEYDAAQSLFENRKHHMRGSVPVMHVIDEGVFRGYVPINHHWVNSDANAYYSASSHAGKEAGLPQRIKKDVFSMFDLKGYQIVRGLFLSAVAYGPAISISNKCISFNTGCVKKFSAVSHIQILLHPAERKLAIRPCSANDVYNVNWRQSPGGPLYSKTFMCRSFTAALFDIMEWNPDYIYRVRGVWASRRDDEIIVFNLSEAAAAILCAVNESDVPAKKRVVTFPEEWESEFGMEFYQYGIANQFQQLSPKADWKADSKCRPVPDTMQFDVMSDVDLQDMIDGLRTN